jgi:hypothetical protein
MTNEDHLILNKLGEYLLKNFNKRTRELTSVNTKKRKKKSYDSLYGFIYVSFIIQFSI